MKDTQTKTIRRSLIALLCVVVIAGTGLFIAPTKHADADTPSAVPMYRLYNKWTQEHFYTASNTERQRLIKQGWNDEQIGWYAPATETSTPVYRLYNPYDDDHHYTMGKAERDRMKKAGWKDEGIGWYSADTGETVPLYREYNPWLKQGSHNYTTSLDEHKRLCKIGWRDENTAWYGVNVPEIDTTSGNQVTTPGNQVTTSYIVNTNSNIFHNRDCPSVSKMSESNKWYYEGTRQSLIDKGYKPCDRCNP